MLGAEAGGDVEATELRELGGDEPRLLAQLRAGDLVERRVGAVAQRALRELPGEAPERVAPLADEVEALAVEGHDERERRLLDDAVDRLGAVGERDRVLAHPHPRVLVRGARRQRAGPRRGHRSRSTAIVSWGAERGLGERAGELRLRSRRRDERGPSRRAGTPPRRRARTRRARRARRPAAGRARCRTRPARRWRPAAGRPGRGRAAAPARAAFAPRPAAAPRPPGRAGPRGCARRRARRTRRRGPAAAWP